MVVYNIGGNLIFSLWYNFENQFNLTNLPKRY